MYLLHNFLIDTYFEISFMDRVFFEENINQPIISVSRDQNLEIPENFLKEQSCIESNLNYVRIYYSNVAYIEIFNDGSNIVIKELFSKSNEFLFLSKFINHVIPFALYQKKKLMLHASGISKSEEGIIFMGSSGSGKSSLAASFQDYQIISEDSVCAEIENEECFVSNSFPFVKLTPEMANHLGYNKNERIALPGDKKNRSYYGISKFVEKRIKIKKCYILKWGDKFKIEPIKLKDFIASFLLSNYSSIPLNSCKESLEIQHSYAAKFLSSVSIYSLVRKKDNLFSDNDFLRKHFISDKI